MDGGRHERERLEETSAATKLPPSASIAMMFMAGSFRLLCAYIVTSPSIVYNLI